MWLSYTGFNVCKQAAKFLMRLPICAAAVARLAQLYLLHVYGINVMMADTIVCFISTHAVEDIQTN